jgi:hypothetical protein
MTASASSILVQTLVLSVACCALGACSSDPEPSGGLGSLGILPAGSGGMLAAAGGSAAGAGGGTGGAAGGATASAGAGGASSSAAGAATSTAGAAGAGAGGKAGTGGSAGSGGSGGAAATCTGAALCDSFERATLGGDWMLDNNTASTMIELVTNKGHTGMNSVHISFGTQATQSYISETKGFPGAANAIWGRAWIFSMVPLGGHQIYIEARVGPGSDKTGVRSANTFDSNNGYLGLNLESSDASKSSMIKMTRGSWVCYEWQITGIGGMGSFSSWADGTLIATQSGAIPKLTRERIGIQRYNAGTAGEMWIDDVAIAEQRINCAP